MTYTFYNMIPAANNNPSNDQPLMLVNNQSTQSIIAVDHIGFNAANGGYHTIIHQGPQGSDPAAITGFGQTYTKTIGGDVVLFYESGNGVVTQLTSSTGTSPSLSLKAWALVNGVTGAIIGGQSIGVASVIRNSTGNYTVTLSPVLADANYGVIPQCTVNSGFTSLNIAYSVTDSSHFNLSCIQPATGNAKDPISLTFIVLHN